MCAGNNRFFPFCCHSDFAVISEYYETLGICPEAGPRGQISTPDPREQISPPGPRRFAPAEAPKFVSSIQLALEATSGSPITTTRSPITSRISLFVNSGGIVGLINTSTERPRLRPPEYNNRARTCQAEYRDNATFVAPAYMKAVVKAVMKAYAKAAAKREGKALLRRHFTLRMRSRWASSL